MFMDFLIGFVIAAALFALLHYLKTRLLSPVPKGRNMRFSLVIAVNGAAPELENTVKALGWLRQSGKLDTEIVLRDCGMDDNTAAVAAKLAREGEVRIII